MSRACRKAPPLQPPLQLPLQPRSVSAVRVCRASAPCIHISAPPQRHVFFTRKKQQQNNQVHGPAISFSLLASVYLYTLVLTYDLPVFDTFVFTSIHIYTYSTHSCSHLCTRWCSPTICRSSTHSCSHLYMSMLVSGNICICMCVCVYRYMRMSMCLVCTYPCLYL